jgi:hypothetical protein
MGRQDKQFSHRGLTHLTRAQLSDLRLAGALGTAFLELGSAIYLSFRKSPVLPWLSLALQSSFWHFHTHGLRQMKTVCRKGYTLWMTFVQELNETARSLWQCASRTAPPPPHQFIGTLEPVAPVLCQSHWLYQTRDLYRQ